MMQAASSVTLFETLYRDWWPEMPAYLRGAEARRHAFHLDRVAQHTVPGDTVCDVGGGWGIFAVACAMIGRRAILVDDFGDSGFFDKTDRRFEMQRSVDVTIIDRDVAAEGVDLPANSLAAVTCFDSIEHWHRSPRMALHQCMQALRPGGLFLLSTPNCVSVRKRITVPFGRGKWSAMSEWYDAPVFRSHVREPDVSDLEYIARDLNLENVEIIGRNWCGLAQPSRVLRAATKAFDPLVRHRPSLCTDIYVVGRKPGADGMSTER